MRRIFIITISIFFAFSSFSAFSFEFDKKFEGVKREIVKDDIGKALKVLGKINISNDKDKEQSQLLFGDIYLHINKPNQAIEFYEKSLFTSNNDIEAYANEGLAEAHLLLGKLQEAIEFIEQAITHSPSKIRTKIILATAKNRIGEKESAKTILNNLYLSNRQNLDVVMAISDFYLTFDNSKKATEILERFVKANPENFEVLDSLANLYWLNDRQKEAIALKYKLYQYFTETRNFYQSKKVKNWLLSIDPNFFNKKWKQTKINKQKVKQQEEKKVQKYIERKITPHFEEIDFNYNSTGSGFIVGAGKYVITNNHVIKGATQIAVRNGIGQVRDAKVLKVSKKYDLAILELSNSYNASFAIKDSDFENPKEGMDVLSIGYPMTGAFGNRKPVITQGIISKVYEDKYGIFLTTTNINSGNSGGPIFDLNGRLVGVTVATLNKEEVYKKTGRIPNAIGIAIKSNMINQIFKFNKKNYLQNVKLEKSAIYEKKLPSVVFIAVKSPRKSKNKK